MTSAEDDRLAAEHVLGLLEGDEARRAEARADRDAAFGALVVAWRARFAELDETAPAVAPAESLWTRIEAQAFAPAAAAAPARGARRASAWRRVWDDLAFWRWTGMSAAIATLALAIGLAFALHAASRKPVLIAVLLTDANQAAALVNVGSDGRADLVPLQPVAVPPGRVLEVWTLWDRTRGPVSLGTLQAARNASLRLDRLPPVVPNQLFEITIEPEGG